MEANATPTLKLTGRDAIAFATINGLTLNKYEDPTKEAREGLTVEEANDVARYDHNLIWLEADKPTGRYEVRRIEVGDLGKWTPGLLLKATDSSIEAADVAEEWGGAWELGICVVDTMTGTVNYGEEGK